MSVAVWRPFHDGLDAASVALQSLQLGTTENHKYSLFYVPSQYVKAIQNCIMQNPYGFLA